jgi:LPS-assembly protein
METAMHWSRVVVLTMMALTLLSAQGQQVRQPLYLQADQLFDDTGGNRVIVQGKVEIYYNRYILVADQLTYDRSANTLTADGNIVLKDPDGSVLRAHRMEMSADFRDAFGQSLSAATPDRWRIGPR